MKQIRHACPRCAVHTDFVLLGWLEYSPLTREEAMKVFNLEPKLFGIGVEAPASSAQKKTFETRLRELECVTACSFATCPHCSQKVLFVIALSTHAFGLLREMRSVGFTKGEKTTDFVLQAAGRIDEGVVLFTYPEAMRITGHPSWPHVIQTHYRSARKTHLDEKDPNPALVISLVRSCFDVALKELGAKGAGFKKGVEDLKAKGLLTVPLADWADRIRLHGNAAIHEIEGTHEEAEEALAFLEIFLRVCFEIPAEIAMRASPPAMPAAQLPQGNGTN